MQLLDSETFNLLSRASAPRILKALLLRSVFLGMITQKSMFDVSALHRAAMSLNSQQESFLEQLSGYLLLPPLASRGLAEICIVRLKKEVIHSETSFLLNFCVMKQRKRSETALFSQSAECEPHRGGPKHICKGDRREKGPACNSS